MLNGACMANRSRVLVTGGAGFIGRRLFRALLAEGHEVTVADLRAFPDPGVRTFVGDLCDPEAAARAVQPGTDVIMHLAAVTSVLASVQDPVSTHLLNVDATARLLELGRENEVGTFLLASTNAVVGNVGSAVINEQIVLRPLTPYGATKAAGDGEGVKVRGDGTMLRDVVHVDDIVQGTLAAWRSGHNGPLILGAGRSVTVNEMVTIARQVTGAPIPVETVPVPRGEMPAVVLDISAARAVGYEPAHTLETGMATVWPDFAPEGTQA